MNSIAAVRAAGAITAALAPGALAEVAYDHDVPTEGGLYPTDPRLSMAGLIAALREGRQIALQTVDDLEAQHTGDALESVSQIAQVTAAAPQPRVATASHSSPWRSRRPLHWRRLPPPGQKWGHPKL